jgi:hypothetical protein
MEELGLGVSVSVLSQKTSPVSQRKAFSIELVDIAIRLQISVPNFVGLYYLACVSNVMSCHVMSCQTLPEGPRSY